MKKCNFLLALVVVLNLTSCKQGNKPVVTSQPEKQEYVKAVNKGNINFESYFIDKTMRFDYFHAGTAIEEHFSTDRIVSDGIWSGSKKKLIDDLKLGLYYFEVIDKESKTLLYTRGFASIFGEWQTIPEASEKWGTFHESIRLSLIHI